MTTARIQHFYHQGTGTLSYVVSDRRGGTAAVIDPVLGFSLESGRIDTSPADAVVDYVRAEELSLDWILETHAHADHLTGAQHVRSRLGGRIAIGEGIRKVQAHFVPLFNLGDTCRADGSQFDHLFSNGERFRIGALECEVIATPGHTNDSMSYRIGDAVFVGDSLFMPDYGTARCDFPGGDAGVLYDSIRKLLSLPGETMLYMCHDYLPHGRELRWCATVNEQRARNVHVADGITRSAFRAMRDARDKTLGLPTLIVPSIQVNIRAGRLPAVEANGIAYIRIPIDRF